MHMIDGYLEEDSVFNTSSINSSCGIMITKKKIILLTPHVPYKKRSKELIIIGPILREIKGRNVKLSFIKALTIICLYYLTAIFAKSIVSFFSSH